MTNVRCAGGGTAPWVTPADGRADGPCGWKGERLGWISAAQLPGETNAQLKERVSTAKPCPWCRGRVELIPEATR